MAKARKKRSARRRSTRAQGNAPISFKLTRTQVKAIEAICGGRAVKFCGYIVHGKLIVTELTCLPPGYVPANAVFMPPPPPPGP